MCRLCRQDRENATTLTSMQWNYLKVPQAGFEKLDPGSFGDLRVFLGGA